MLYSHLWQVAKYSDNISRSCWLSKKCRYAVRNMEMSHYNRENEARLTNKTEIKAIIGLLCLAVALRINPLVPEFPFKF